MDNRPIAASAARILLFMRTLWKSLLDWLEFDHVPVPTRTRDRRPSRAPDSACGAADFLFDLIDGGGGRTGRARRWHGQQADRRVRRPDTLVYAHSVEIASGLARI